MEIDLLFIDFTQAFDSLKQNKSMEVLKELGVTCKVKMTLN